MVPLVSGLLQTTSSGHEISNSPFIKIEKLFAFSLTEAN